MGYPIVEDQRNLEADMFNLSAIIAPADGLAPLGHLQA